MSSRNPSHILIAILLFVTGCANITTPTGGKKDITPPKLISIEPADSLKNTRVKRIELYFNEYIAVTDATKEVQISPLLTIQPTVTGLYKHVVVKIADTLLDSNTTYRISFGNAIKDLHENNVFKNYTYTFSTGSYFDSLKLSGRVVNAATGVPDSSGVIVVLYNGTEKDSAVVRKKPKYVTTADASGAFQFKGLPKRSFKIYAIKDPNGNLMYDGPGEGIGFADAQVMSGDTSAPPPLIRTFEEPDTAVKTKDSAQTAKSFSKPEPAKEGFSCSVNVDTSNISKRTFDIRRGEKYNPLILSFNHLPVLFKDRISLSYDSNGVSKTATLNFNTDTAHRNQVSITTTWLENTAYTLKLAKGFAKDTAGKEAQPGKYIFRTREEDDYGKITVHLPAKYKSNDYLLMVYTDRDTTSLKPVSDTLINFTWLQPARYYFRVIVDKNHNGKWDPGSLFERIQPEEVIPYKGNVTLKPGWENTIDFEQKPEPQKSLNRSGSK